MLIGSLMMEVRTLMLNKNVFKKRSVKKHTPKEQSHIRLHAEEFKVKNVNLMMTVTETEATNALIFGKKITFKKIQFALTERNVDKR